MHHPTLILKAAARATLRTLLAPAPVSRAVRRLIDSGVIPTSIAPRLPARGVITLTLPGGGTFRYSALPDDAIGRALFWTGLNSWEAETIPVFMALARSARFFLDVGANTGTYSLIACTVNRSLRCQAFEPVPQTHAKLQENVLLNGLKDRITLSTAAVSDRDGKAEFHVPFGDLPPSASLNVNGFRGARGQLIAVPTVRLDSLQLPQVDLAKIDVEGFEDNVLRGMSGILERDKPVLIVEILRDGPGKQATDILAAHNYRFFKLVPGGPVQVPELRTAATDAYHNYLCTHESRGLPSLEIGDQEAPIAVRS